MLGKHVSELVLIDVGGKTGNMSARNNTEYVADNLPTKTLAS
jgi:hypothetical protein